MERTIDRAHQHRCNVISSAKREIIGDSLRKLIKDENNKFSKISFDIHVQMIPLLFMYFTPYVLGMILLIVVLKEYIV